jgi:hypothetical protein
LRALEILYTGEITLKLEDIMTEAEKYLEIDETNLAKESIETPKMYGRLLRIRTSESMLLQKYKFQLKKLYQDKRDYYLGRADPKVYKEKPFDLKILKSEVDTYIEADEEIRELTLKIEMQNEKIEYLDNVLKQIANRNYAIKNAIDFQKMMNGGF